MMLLKCLAADLQKTKHLPFWIAHLGIPVCTALVFLLYYAGSPWSAQSKMEGFYQVLGMGFPVLIGLFTVMLAQQEGPSFQTMLSAPRRLPLFYSKFLLLVLSGAGSVFVTSILFGVGNCYVLGQSVTGMGFYFSAAFLLVGSNVFTYLFHWFLALRFNKGVSIMVGVTEGIVAALMVTGLGDRIWCYVPCAWGSRMVTYLVLDSVGIQVYDQGREIAGWLCAVITVCAILLFGVWTCHWEGKQGSQ